MYSRPAYLWLAWLLQVIIKALMVDGYKKGAKTIKMVWGSKYGASCAAALAISFVLFLFGFIMPCAREAHASIFDYGAFAYLLFGAVPLFKAGADIRVDTSLKAASPETATFLLLAGAMLGSWGLTCPGSCGVGGFSIGTCSVGFGLLFF